MKTIIKNFFLIIFILLSISLIGCNRKESNTFVKVSSVVFEGTVSGKEKDNKQVYFPYVFDNSKKEYDMYSVSLKINNITNSNISSAGVTYVDSKGNIVSTAKDIRAENAQFSYEISNAIIKDGFTFEPGESDELEYKMLIEKGKKVDFDADFYYLKGNEKELSKIVIHIAY